MRLVLTPRSIQSAEKSGGRDKRKGSKMVLAMTFRILLGLLIILVLLGVGLYAAAIKAPRAPQGEVEQSDVIDYLDRLVASNAATAVSIAVLRDGNVVWEHATGQANPFEDRAASPDTVYHIWSVTKVATAMAVLDLVEDGLLDLDAPVTEYLPWFEIEPMEGRAMTVRDLLGHRSGLRDTVPAVFGWLRYDEAIPNQTDFLMATMPEYRSLRFAPGEDRRYSNLGYMVLGAIIEAVTGQEYSDVIRGRVLAPAGMASSGFIYTSDLAQEEALGSHPIIHFFSPLLPFLIDMGEFVREREGILLWQNRLYVEATPPTGLIASARDAVHLAHAAMVPGVVLEGETLGLMLPQTAEQTPLGWFERGGETRPWLQHRGGGPGYAATVRVYPDEGFAIAVLASGTAAPTTTVADLIARIEY